MPWEPMVAIGFSRRGQWGFARQWRIWPVFLLIVTHGHFVRAEAAIPPAAPVDARAEATSLAQQYVQQAVAALDADARNGFREAQTEQLAAEAAHGPPALIQGLSSLDASSRQALAAVLEFNNQAALEALDAAYEKMGARREALVNQWQAVRATQYDERFELFEIQANKQIAGQLASLLSVDNRWFWLCGSVAVVCLVIVAAHERRHEMRRRLNGGRARAMGLSKLLGGLAVFLALVTLATFVFGDRVYHWLLRAGTGAEATSREEMLSLNRSVAEKLRASQERGRVVDAEYERAVERWRPSAPSAASRSELVDQSVEARGLVEKLAVNLAVEAGVAERLEADLAELKQLRQDVAANAEQRNIYRRRKQWIRGGLGLGLLGLATGGGALFRRGVRRRLEQTRNTCPQCLGEGTFEPLSNQILSGPGSGGGRATLDMVQCKNVISQHPYEECEFTFMSMYREIAKLCFPTLGIPQAGKTHWLAMVYRELNRGNYPEVVQFERIKSASSDEFDLVVDEILNKKMGPMATQVGRIPHPLVFNFLDRDRFGSSNILVNIFDYSGEVTRSQTIEDHQRQRALDGDGFFFFLDPTEPSETQSQALAGFREDLRRVKGLKAGKQVHIPVALCVSKIDLMVDEPYADPNGGGVVEHFYRDLGEIGWRMDLKSIAARSRCMAQLRDTVWPGWQIERQIDDLFGGRFMFFPLTPVGLDGLGERDLSRRTIAPVGLLEPLLWLLHMNGYPVLKS
ncbi:MAG TPA: hypothetical protein VN699_06625 [Pirellulales bacterium]|nr:hypothetical protein [Pirellulales bacterium]